MKHEEKTLRLLLFYLYTHSQISFFHNMPCSLRLNLNREPECVIEKAGMLQR